jgi:hypothetical protein
MEKSRALVGQEAPGQGEDSGTTWLLQPCGQGPFQQHRQPYAHPVLELHPY